MNEIDKRTKMMSFALASTLLLTAISSTSSFATTGQLPIKTPFSSSTFYNKKVCSLSPPLSKTTLEMGDESDPEPLAKEGQWRAFLDEETTGLIYYFNVDTGVSMWEPPTKTFPKVRMSRGEKKAMMSIREKYVDETKKKKEEKAQESKVKRESFFGSLFGGDDDENDVKDESKQVDAGIVTDIEVVVAASDPKPKEEKKGTPSLSVPFFGAFTKPAEDTSTKTDSATKTSVSPSPTPEKIQVTTKPRKAIKIEIGTKVIPHPEKIAWGGEDAVFAQGRTFGVFDGVSGAEKEDGLPLYSVTLANEMKKSSGKKSLQLENLRKNLLSAAELADETATGASTAIVASLGEDGILKALNMGDSCLLVVRDGEVFAQSKDIVHYFDCPYQLAAESPDRPIDGTTLKTELKPGDTIVMGSDGVFDNLTKDAICDIVKTGSSAKAIASTISLESRRIGDDPNAITPYAQEAKKIRYEGYEEYSDGLGGKVDDVSCVVVKCS